MTQNPSWLYSLRPAAPPSFFAPLPYHPPALASFLHRIVFGFVSQLHSHLLRKVSRSVANTPHPAALKTQLCSSCRAWYPFGHVHALFCYRGLVPTAIHCKRPESAIVCPSHKRHSAWGSRHVRQQLLKDSFILAQYGSRCSTDNELNSWPFRTLAASSGLPKHLFPFHNSSYSALIDLFLIAPFRLWASQTQMPCVPAYSLVKRLRNR